VGHDVDPALRALLDRHGIDRDAVASIWSAIRDRTAAEVDAVERDAAAGSPIPEVRFDDLDAGDDLTAVVDAVRRRGCLVVRGTFPPDLALRWDDEVARYLDENRFEDRYRERYPDDVHRIWGIYWSPPQVAARQHPRMETTRAFLNSIWRHESEGRAWFDPGRDIGYADRLRRRAPGRPARGLLPHSDAESSNGWRSAENELVFRHVLAGDVDRYDPWDAAHRTALDPGTSDPPRIFRTFQGWTALSEMHPDDGVLHLVPIPTAAAYLLVRGIAGELGLLDGDPEPAPRRFRADDLLLRALVPIPAVEPGDTVWWHGDVIHSVADATNDTRWGNVMYIGAAPSCPRNDAYRATTFDRFERGASPIDFPDEDFEVDFTGRPTVADLGPVAREHFGIGVV
jgi:hypothetical protein